MLAQYVEDQVTTGVITTLIYLNNNNNTYKRLWLTVVSSCVLRFIYTLIFLIKLFEGYEVEHIYYFA